MKPRVDFVKIFWLAILALVFLPVIAVEAREAADYSAELGLRQRQLIEKMQQCARDGKPEEGLKLFARAADDLEKIPVLLIFVAANLNFQQTDYQAAVKLYRLVIKKAPEFYVAYENLGQAELTAGNYAAAAETLQLAARQRPERADDLLYQAGVALLYAEKPAAARDLFMNLLAGHQKPPLKWLKALLQAHWRLQDNAAALAVAERLLGYEPQNLENWRICGQLRMATGDYRGAMSAWKVLQSAGALKDHEWRSLAGVYQQLRLPAQAAAAWTQYLRHSDDAKLSDWETLSALYAAADNLDGALQAIGKMSAFIDQREVDWRKAQLLYRFGRYREALPVLQNLAPVAEEDGYRFLLAGYCAWKLNDFSVAAKAWGKAAAYPDWTKRAQSLLQRLKPWLESEKLLSGVAASAG